MKLTSILLTAALCTTALDAAAAPTADLGTAGRIIPSSCDIALSGNGEIDLGSIPATDLNVDRRTQLPFVTTALSVTCSAATRFALKFTDMRDGTRSEDLFGGFGFGQTPAGENIGFYVVEINQESHSGGTALYATLSSDDGATWSRTDGNSVSFRVDPRSIAGWSTTEGSTAGPVAINNLDASMHVGGFIAPTNSLTLTSQITLDGLAIVEIRYL